jgi:hypothetical protein
MMRPDAQTPHAVVVLATLLLAAGALAAPSDGPAEPLVPPPVRTGAAPT